MKNCYFWRTLFYYLHANIWGTVIAPTNWEYFNFNQLLKKLSGLAVWYKNTSLKSCIVASLYLWNQDKPSRQKSVGILFRNKSLNADPLALCLVFISLYCYFKFVAKNHHYEASVFSENYFDECIFKHWNWVWMRGKQNTLLPAKSGKQFHMEKLSWIIRKCNKLPKEKSRKLTNIWKF